MITIIGAFLLSFCVVVGLAYMVTIGRAHYLDYKDVHAHAHAPKNTSQVKHSAK